MIDDGAEGRDTKKRPDTTPFVTWLLERPDVVVGAYLSALALLAYPAALTALWSQLADHYGWDYWTALYAAASVPVSFVAGKLPIIAFFSIATNAAACAWCVHGWGYRASHRAAYEMPGNPLGLEDPDAPRSEDGKTTLGQMLFVYQRIAFLLAAVSLPPVMVYEFSPSASVGLLTWLLVVALTVVGGYFGATLLAKAYETESRRTLYKAIVVVYAASLLAAVPLAGSTAPNLPKVEMDLDGQQRTYSLLSHSGGHWNVVDREGNLLAVPDEDAGLVRFASESAPSE